MPKKKGRQQAGGKGRSQARRERQAGLYLSPGDPDFKSLSDQLRVQGLALKDVPGDGNCLFRALAEQLDDRHGNLRRAAVKHMRENRADYLPFLDEDTSFESYVDELSKDGTYAGNDAIVAVSRSRGVNVVIHQLGAARWEIRPPPSAHGALQTLHIAYLRGEHYCSVCPLNPKHALPQLEHQPEPTHSPVAAVAAAVKPEPYQEGGSDVRCVLEATGCQDEGLAEQCLRESGGEISLAIVELLQLMALNERETGLVPSEGGIQVERKRPSKASGGSQSRPACSQSRPAGKLPSGGQRHLSNRERKEAAKAVRKEAARETRRERRAMHDKDDDQSEQDPVGSRII